MKAVAWFAIGVVMVGVGMCLDWSGSQILAGPKPESYWQMDDVKPGMKGYGRTVMHGTKVEDFSVEILGVLKNISPGRDMVLCRLSGLGLEKTGVIAGMSGSPVYINDKLLGAVSHAWAFGKEPIAGITPFCQMHGYVEAYERRDMADKEKPARVGRRAPRMIDGLTFDTATVVSGEWGVRSGEKQEGRDLRLASGPGSLGSPRDELWMVPLQLPIAAAGFTSHSLNFFRERCPESNMLPVQAGGTSAKIAEEEKNTPLQPGGPLAVALVTGDFDMSGLGTVTHIEGNRVYGWGHPFFGLGACEYPLKTGYVHTVYPAQSISFKMGSPLRTVGIINADVSTGIAGWLDRKPDMLPVAHDGHAGAKRDQQDVQRPDRSAAPVAGRARGHGADQFRGHGRTIARRANCRNAGDHRR